jgi:4-amino-4-deoxy-L-arabinose transferase-like glycosyltransferase
VHEQPVVRASPHWWRRSPGGPLLAILAAKVVLTLATDNRYGYHRDELYYAVTAHRLAFGYVDFPPVTPLMARLAQALFGTSLVGLRTPALVAGVGVVLLTAAMAKELGGTPRAQWLAALGVTTCAFFLAANGLLQTVSFDTLAWALALYAFVRIVREGSPKWWLALGAAIGLGMLTKFTMPALVAGLGAGVLLTPIRRALRTPWPWLAALVAIAIATPNLAWQVAHGWPSIAFLRGQNARVRGDNPTTKYITDQLFTLGPFVLIVCGAGAAGLWRGVRERALVWVAVTVELVYLVFHGKGYYPLDVFPVLIAAGAVSVASWRRWRVVAIGLVVFTLVGLPISLPVLPESTMLRFSIDKARDDYSAELGWPTVVASIAHAYREVPAAERTRSLILTQNYSQASAVNLLGGRLGLPRAYSGHNTYWLWLPPHASIDSIVAVGFTKAQLQRWFARLSPLGAIPDRRQIDVEERGEKMYWCTQPRVTTKQLWSAVKVFS